jgi:type I restriction enzyme R subunit
VQIYEPGEGDPVTPPDDAPPTEDGENAIPPEPSDEETVVDGYPPPDITLPPGVAEAPVTVLTERVEYLDDNGKLVTESLHDYSRKTIRQHYASLDEFLRRWNAAERREAVIEELAEEGLLLDPLLEEVGKDLDPFDLICHIAFDQPPLTRRDRANNVRQRDVFSRYGPQARAVLEALLTKYQDEGIVTGLDNTKILEIPPFNTMGTPIQLIRPFGSRAGFEQAVHELQAAIYQEIA